VNIDGAGTVVYSGSNKTYNSSTVVKAGALKIATLLSGTGNMTVNSGATLIVSGTLGAGSGGSLTVNGTLGGNGSIEREFTVGNGAVLAPGESIGKLTTVNQTWTEGGTFVMELGSVNGGMGIGWDGIAITGTLDLSGLSATKQFIFSLSSLTPGGTSGIVSDFHGNTSYQWTFLTTTGGIIGFDADQFLLDLAHFHNAYDGTFSIIQSGNNLILDYEAVPEPSTYALLAAGALGYALNRRRRKAA